MIARNKLIHALANRPGPFHHEIFGYQPEFEPAVFPGPLAELRDHLCLNDTSTDYYLMRYAALIEAFPDLIRALEDRVLTYRVWEFLPRGLAMDGGEFVDGDLESGYREPDGNSLPLNLHYTIECVNATLSRIVAVEHGLVRLCTTLASGEITKPWVRISWPSDIPFVGVLRLDQPWLPGARLNLEVEPSRFPYVAMVERIQSNEALNRLLVNHDLLSEFHGSFDAMEKLAIALTVVALANPAVYGN